MDLKVQRKSVTSSQATQFLFDVKGTQYIVKNFTEGNIYVALKETQNKTDCILIPSQTAQIVEFFNGIYNSDSGIVTVISDENSDTGVEVQCIKW